MIKNRSGHLDHISIPRKLVLGSFDNINFKNVFFAHKRYNDKLKFSNNLSLDILHGAYSFGDLIFFHWSWPLKCKIQNVVANIG